MESKGLVNELVEGRELTRELQLNLSNEPHFSSNEAYGLIAKNILAKFERSLQILQYHPIKQTQFHRIGTSGCPNSFSGSPKSQDSDGNFKVLEDNKDDSRKRRRISPRVTQRVQGCTRSGLEGPIEDGYNWRKYGQKDILGAKFPRAYYRCTFRGLQGCPATKQVQRIDDDPSFFEVTYRSNHTCSQANSSPSYMAPNPKPELDPIETMWDFKRDSIKDIESVITNNNNYLESSSLRFSSSSNPLVIDTQRTPISMLNYTYQSSPSLVINDIGSTIDDQQRGLIKEVVHTSSISGTNSPLIGSEISFDHQGDCDEDNFILHNSHLF